MRLFSGLRGTGGEALDASTGAVSRAVVPYVIACAALAGCANPGVEGRKLRSSSPGRRTTQQRGALHQHAFRKPAEEVRYDRRRVSADGPNHCIKLNDVESALFALDKRHELLGPPEPLRQFHLRHPVGLPELYQEIDRQAVRI